MTNSIALLPEGLRDTLPPYAGAEARLLRILLDTLGSHGFERVVTPLVEFEDTLDACVASGRPHERFRFMDPVSHRSLAVREDITGQIARLAATRLAHWPRPLRLSYAGPVLRMRGTQLRADRQFLQVGAELIGNVAPAAIAEVILLSVEAVRAVGIADVSVDIVMPDFIDMLASGLDEGIRLRLLDIFDAKDTGALAALNLPEIFSSVMRAAGPAKEAVAQLQALKLRGDAPARVAVVDAVVSAVEASGTGVALTLDPGERRGFEYQTGFGFSLFSRSVRGEIGRGGSYQIRAQDGRLEDAVGFSLYLDGLIETGVGVEAQPRVLLPRDCKAEVARQLRQDGYVTVWAIGHNDLHQQAKDQRCTALWANGALQPVKE